jgi:hypothetical protein
MNETQIDRSRQAARSRRRGRRQDILARLAELLARDHPNDSAWAIAEDERLARARLALFGCAPK